MENKVEFTVTVCLGGGDGGDISVEVNVTDEEYELLKECAKEELEISDYDGLESLVERIEKEATAEADELSGGEDYGNPSFIIYMPLEFEPNE